MARGSRLSPAVRIAVVLLVGVLVIAAIPFVWAWWSGRDITDIGSLDLPSFGALPTPVEGEETLLAMGDIGSCDGTADEQVAALADELPGTIAMLGDDVYPNGTAANYRDCLQPAWGPMLSRTRPAIGNHDYVGDSADAYFSFFGSSAGDAGQGWYSYDLGAWHVVVLNSNCGIVGCGAGSAQLAWLADDLRAHAADCLLAYWHHPRWSSGRHGSNAFMDPMWQALVDAGADVILNGHDHDYEHVAADGVDQFVVGTGGRSLYRFPGGPLASTVTRREGTYGLLSLTLADGSYAWRFLSLGSTAFTDAGSGSC